MAWYKAIVPALTCSVMIVPWKRTAGKVTSLHRLHYLRSATVRNRLKVLDFAVGNSAEFVWRDLRPKPKYLTELYKEEDEHMHELTTNTYATKGTNTEDRTSTTAAATPAASVGRRDSGVERRQQLEEALVSFLVMRDFLLRLSSWELGFACSRELSNVVR